MYNGIRYLVMKYLVHLSSTYVLCLLFRGLFTTVSDPIASTHASRFVYVTFHVATDRLGSDVVISKHKRFGSGRPGPWAQQVRYITVRFSSDGTECVEPDRTEPEPNRTDGTYRNRTEPNRTEPNRTEPNRTEPNRTEPSRTRPNRTVRKSVRFCRNCLDVI